MKPRLFSIRLGAVIGLAWLLAHSSTQASDVQGFRVLKGQNFIQTSTGAAMANGVSNFVMLCEADFQPAGALTNLTFTKPNMQVLSAFPDGDTHYGFEQSFSSQAALDAEFPSGTYTVIMKTLNDGTKAVPLALTGDTYPNTPRISNFTAAQAVVPSLDFTLTWDSLGGTVNDFVFLNIRDGGGQEVFSGPEMGQPGALDGTSTSLLIPARKLRPGQVYQVELFIARASQPPDQVSYPGATGIAGYFKQLKFSLITTGFQTGPTAGNFSLVFNFPQGVFDGTNGSITFPRSLGYYYALYNIQNDVNYPASVAFTGPGGSGLTNVPSQVNGSTFGSSAFYSSPQVNFSPANLPPEAIYSSTQPSGGIYTVSYKTSNYQFNLLDPRSADQQILVVPTVVLSSTNTIQEIRWTYKNTNGTTVAPQAFMDNIQIRVNGTSGGRLYDGGNDDNRILPAVTSHTPTAVVPWTNVSSIQMLFVDTVGNQYVSYWNRAVQPVEITTTGLPNAQQGTPFNFLLSSQGGTQPVSWSVLSGNLPSGLSLNANTGEILGTPGENGSFPLTFRAVDSANAATNRSLFLFVAAGSFPAPVLTNAALLGNGQLKVVLGVVSNQTYTLESSTNLINWTPRVTLLATNSQVDLLDTNALGSFPRLFYRMRIGRP